MNTYFKEIIDEFYMDFIEECPDYIGDNDAFRKYLRSHKDDLFESLDEMIDIFGYKISDN